MKKTVTVTRKRVVELKELFTDVAEITPMAGSSGTLKCPACGHECDSAPEPFGKVQTFKYRAMRNADTCESMGKSFMPALDKIRAETPEMAAYFKAQDEMLARFTKKDADGKPVCNEDGSPVPDIARGDEIKAAFVELKAAHAPALAQHAQREADVQAFMVGTVDIELFTCDFNELPWKLSGAWMKTIVEMVENMPVLE